MATPKSLVRQSLKPLAVAAAVIVASTLGVTYWSNDLVERTLLGHAESSAITWRTEISGSVPELERLIETSRATAEQRTYIEASMAGSDIFRFELFDAHGDLAFVSDKALFETEAAEVFNQNALEVARSGRGDISVEDGREKHDRPDWYVEAYMPIFGEGGATIGVAEVYVDVSGLAAALRAKFNRLTALLLAVTALIYLIPTYLLIRRNDQLRQRDRQLLQISRLDPLTGLMNRGSFNETAESLFQARDAQGQALGVLFVDLDRFKEVNDTCGHDVGDELLRNVAASLRGVCRKQDIVARIGGDEFVILCPDVQSEDIDCIGARLMALTETAYHCGGNDIRPSFSVGAHISPSGEPERRALHRADLAVYKAKSNGRGQVVRYTSALELEDARRRFVADHVERALDNDLFYLEFQPIYDGDGGVAGLEALLRLRTAEGEQIPPAEFIPIAEQSGLIERLGLWTVRHAIIASTDWPDHVWVSVNVSAHEFRSGKLPAQIEQALRDSGVAAGRVCLELTEGTLIEHSDAVAEQLADIKGAGIRIAIDDFGTGYSSLGYLWRYRFDRLKIDKSFLEGYSFDSARYRDIIETIIVLGHQLDMTVVAEGVETEAHLSELRSLGCDHFQGFLLGYPMSRFQARSLFSRSATG